MGINQKVEKLVSRLGKHQSFAFDARLQSRDRLLLGRHVGGWALRGFWRRLWFKKAQGLVLIGARVQIRYPHYLQVGKNFIVEDGAEIMALSQEGIICGDNVTIGAYASIKPTNYYGRNLGVGLRIGNHSNIGRYSYIGCSGRITIGNNVMMGPRVGLFAENHRFNDTERLMREQGVKREPIIIEDDCWLASSSTILAGVTVGQGSIVAAGSVVTQDVPPFSIVAGSPAKLIRSRHATEKEAT